MKCIIPEGGYFMIADWSSLGYFFFTIYQKILSTYILPFTEPFVDLSEKKYKEKDYCFVEWLTRVKKLAAIPPSAFYSAEDKHLGEKYIRFCFIKVRNIF
jgi:kynurenine--oxoglutarate transaminase/cysteine-S-conjugate beta-lyase/glutamine--phenylpyruvate transaminase